jgi:3-isopropylmalate dehydratase small subunit
VPDPDKEKDPVRREGMERALAYMGLAAEHADRTTSASTRCSSARAPTRASRTCAPRPPWCAGAQGAPTSSWRWWCRARAWSRRRPSAKAWTSIFRDAGFEWREPGCSMCLAMNADRLEPGERCASTSNRNFEGRQGAGGRTHLVSPAMAAAAAASPAISSTCVTGCRTPIMEKFTVAHTVLVAPLDRANVDTDAIIPKQFLKSIQRTGFGPNLFDEWRYLDHGEPGHGPRRRARSTRTSCSTSRATRAPRCCSRARTSAAARRASTRPGRCDDYGFRAVIAPSFADIFFNNCFKNGLLPIVLTEAEVDRLFARGRRASPASG